MSVQIKRAQPAVDNLLDASGERFEKVPHHGPALGDSRLKIEDSRFESAALV
jgi:hypothetical protein